MTPFSFNFLLHELNDYSGDNLWQDVILPSPLYDEEKTDAVDIGRNDRFVLTNGTEVRWDQETGLWDAYQPYYDRAGE